MERQRLSVRKRVGIWGAVYIIGGTEEDGELLPAEQAGDLIARFDHEQCLFGGAAAVPADGRTAYPGFQHSAGEAIEYTVSVC